MYFVLDKISNISNLLTFCVQNGTVNQYYVSKSVHAFVYVNSIYVMYVLYIFTYFIIMYMHMYVCACVCVCNLCHVYINTL